MLKPQRQRGVSLVELVVALTLLALLLAAVLPDVGSWMRGLRVRNGAEALRNGLERARTEALKRNQNVSFWLVTDNTSGCALSSASASWVVSVSDPSGKCDIEPSDATEPRTADKYSSKDGATSVTVAATGADDAAAQSVTFNGFGQVVQTGTPILRIAVSAASGGAKALRVTVAPGGGIRMCDPAAGSSDARAC